MGILLNYLLFLIIPLPKKLKKVTDISVEIREKSVATPLEDSNDLSLTIS